MGRKGIGKFAGFGIARFITVETVCEDDSELTKFELDLNTIRQGDSYVSTQPLEISVLEHKRQQKEITKGTKITLHDLKIARQIPEEQFAKSLARKFLINSTADNFEIRLNGKELPNGTDLPNIELSFSGSNAGERGFCAKILPYLPRLEITILSLFNCFIQSFIVFTLTLSFFAIFSPI